MLAGIRTYYTIPSDNWEQQQIPYADRRMQHYTIPSDNWEQQLCYNTDAFKSIIPYQAITGNNNEILIQEPCNDIIPYQAITGNNNM